MPKLKNPKHELLANNIVKENYNHTQAYLKTYPNSAYDSARSSVAGLLAKNNIKNRVEEIAGKKGLTADYLIEKLYDETKATKPLIYDGKREEIEDHPTRMDAIKTGLKIYGIGEKSEVDNSTSVFNLIVTNKIEGV